MQVILCGYGKMGHILEEMLVSRGDTLAGVVHPGLFASAADIPDHADAIVDFSYPDNLDGTLQRAMQTGCACVIGTTGLSEAQKQQIASAARFAPIVYSANYSIGVAVLTYAVLIFVLRAVTKEDLMLLPKGEKIANLLKIK